MILTSVRINQLSPAGVEWYQRYLAVFDNADADGFADCLTEDCVIQMNDDLPLYGLSAIRPAMIAYMTRFTSIEHEPLNIYGQDHHFAAELLCHYVSHTGKRTTIPASSFVDRREDGLVSSIRFYVNASAAFSGN